MAIPVKNLLHTFFKKESWKLQLLSEWDSIVGNLTHKMRLERIDNSSLIIGVYEASWLQELYLLSSVLMKSINDHLDSPRITRIKFVHATQKISEKKEIPLEKPVTPRIPIILSSKEKKALETIKDVQLQEALHTFLSRCHYEKLKN